MPDAPAALLAIGLMCVVTYATRVGGYLLASRLTDSPKLRRTLEVLPGCAIAGVLAPAAVRGDVIELAALAVTGIVFYRTGQVMLGLGFGIGILLVGGHVIG